MVAIKINVVPRSKRQTVVMKNGQVTVTLISPPEGGKANIELVKFLKKTLKLQATLVSGATSRTKVLEIAGEENEVLQKLRGMAESRVA
jgi:hypothetical protein